MNKLSAKNVIGGLTPADNGQVDRLETWSIDFIRSVAKVKSPLYVGFSGGKDSEVLLHLMRKARVEFNAFYNNTTIDRPGTLSWIKQHKGVIIMQPRYTFFQLLEHRGLPTFHNRFCCEMLKERAIATNEFYGIRQSESTNRKRRNPEPEKCITVWEGRIKHIYMPLLYWKNEHLVEYINAEQIRCHPHYYDSEGKFHVERRLGCLGCPLPSDHCIKDFKQYPRYMRAWCKHLAVYRNTRPRLIQTLLHWRDEYEHFYSNMFCKNLADLDRHRAQPGYNPKLYLEQTFQIELPPPQSPLDEIRKRLSG